LQLLLQYWNIACIIWGNEEPGTCGTDCLFQVAELFLLQPENHTDFIFAVAGEEFGFIGSIVILLLYMLLIWRGLTIALNAEDRFGALLASGITGMYLFHVFVNVGMTIGIMPVTGVPLPFLSYGVSSLTTNMLLAGILLNINLRHTRLQF